MYIKTEDKVSSQEENARCTQSHLKRQAGGIKGLQSVVCLKREVSTDPTIILNCTAKDQTTKLNYIGCNLSENMVFVFFSFSFSNYNIPSNCIYCNSIMQLN